MNITTENILLNQDGEITYLVNCVRCGGEGGYNAAVGPNDNPTVCETCNGDKELWLTEDELDTAITDCINPSEKDFAEIKQDILNG